MILIGESIIQVLKRCKTLCENPNIYSFGFTPTIHIPIFPKLKDLSENCVNSPYESDVIYEKNVIRKQV